MLINLSIKNYALIENLTIDFKDKLTTITGETGAGKSILLGALGLVLGKRADSTTLNSNGNKCVIEAQFSILNYNLDSFFEENDLDFENETIIRREILPGGKSRAFINDTPTTLPVLQALSEKLIDVHSQHQTLKLSDLNFQFKIIDALANNTTTIELYESVLKSFKQRSKELYELKIQQDKTKEDYEYQLHLFEELKQADLHNDEQDIIEKSLDKLNNIEEIKLNLSYAQSNALNDEIGLQTLLNSFENNLKSIAPYSNEYKELYDRIVSLNIEFNDVVNEVVGINENVNFDPFELEKLNDRLQLVYDLQKKHAVNTIADLLAIQLELSKKIDLVENFSAIIAEKENEINGIIDELDKLANSIYQDRTNVIPILVEKLEKMLSNLGMENTSFQFNLSHKNQYFNNGKDDLEILISTNKGTNYGALKKIASGGEMSRIMLVVKAILSKYLKLPTIIFDEIDSGLSGDISQKMAEIMQEMGVNMQVIAITHIPQIASKGEQHYKVFKQNSVGNTVTRIKELSPEERIAEIAEMLSGKNISATAIEHAKQLLH